MAIRPIEMRCVVIPGSALGFMVLAASKKGTNVSEVTTGGTGEKIAHGVLRPSLFFEAKSDVAAARTHSTWRNRGAE